MYRKNRHKQKHIQNTDKHSINHDNDSVDQHLDLDKTNHTMYTEDDGSLVILAKHTTLTNAQKNVLKKGLKFIPKSKHLYRPYIQTLKISCID